MRQPSIRKIFLTLAMVTALLFLIISGALLVFEQSLISYEESFGNQVFSLSTVQLLEILKMEIPFFTNNVQASTKWFNFFSLFTPYNPNEWIKQELPVFKLVAIDNSMPQGNIDLPIELAPPDDFFVEELSKTTGTEETDNQNQEIIGVSTGERNVVFIYHTHNRESFIPELETKNISEAYHPTKNITLVGKRLGEELEKLGIGSAISTKDYWTLLDPGKYYLSYKLSLETVQTTLQNNDDIKFIFDIHRDGIPGGKEKTTRKINGVDYAAVYFVIGEGNKNYQENKEFAIKIHESLERLYPGISRGIAEKQKTSGSNGEYNQSVSPYSLTIEIGGVYNTLEEEYRTAKALAEAIADVYWEAEKVDARP